MAKKNLIMSLGIIGAVAAIAIGGTIAYFSDTETSAGNTFTAGTIDLRVDNVSYVTDQNGTLVPSPENTWMLEDLTGQLFFNFQDLKPGDIGEDTISLHVEGNDAWACMAINLTGTPENGQTEPEAAVDATIGENEGELQNELHFAFWGDDGDNVYETDETNNLFVGSMPASDFSGDFWAIADSSGNNVWGQLGPLQGGEGSEPQYYIGKAWCFGTLTPEPVEPGDGTPLTRGTGFICDGSQVGNESQSDGITADVEFYAVQYRNNPSFLCSEAGVDDIADDNIQTIIFTDLEADPQYGYTHDYSGANVSFEYTSPDDDRISGTITATGLKPYATYQLKFEGKPTCAYGLAGDDEANEQMGYMGRWWNNDTNSNTNDAGYLADSIYHGGTDCITGYLVWGYITADASGNAAKAVTADSSYHVLWCSGGTCGLTNNSLLATGIDPAHPSVYYCAAANVNGEIERGGCGTMTFGSGDYNLNMILNEESFHQGPGTWTAVMKSPIEFTIN